ncbi:MAG TPA: hypothetical protein VMV94_05395, partial [Phycisphaerae bacterium]|nr:hypothetical protein [Phycisphaerae bacterium]
MMMIIGTYFPFEVHTRRIERKPDMKTGKKLLLSCVVLACTCALAASLVAQGPVPGRAQISSPRQAREATAAGNGQADWRSSNAASGTKPAQSVSNVSARPVESVESSPAGVLTVAPQLSKNSAGTAVMPPEGKTKAPSGRSKVYQAENPSAAQPAPALAPPKKSVAVQPTNAGNDKPVDSIG